MDKNANQNADVPENFLTQAVIAAPWGFAVTDCQRKGNPVVFVNQAFELASGHEADEILGKSWHCLLGRGTESHSLVRLQEAVRHGSYCSVVLQRAGKDGSRVHSEMAIAPVLNRSGDVTHLTWVCRDVTPEVERAEHLAAISAENEERFLSFLENATEAIWRLDFKRPIRLDIPDSQQVQEIFDNGVFGECNDAGARVYGLNKGLEVIGNLSKPSWSRRIRKTWKG